MASNCTYKGISYSENEAICSTNGTRYNCFNDEWVAEGSSCSDTDTSVDINVEVATLETTSKEIGQMPETNNICYYNGIIYSSGAPICFNGTNYRCDFGKWLAAGNCEG